MRLRIITYGTRGDVQPFVGLAHGLRDAGHDVVLAAPRNFERWVEDAGVRFAPLHGDALQILAAAGWQRRARSGTMRRCRCSPSRCRSVSPSRSSSQPSAASTRPTTA